MSPQFFFYGLCWPWIAIGFLLTCVWAADRYGEVKVLAVLAFIIVVLMIYIAIYQVQWS